MSTPEQIFQQILANLPGVLTSASSPDLKQREPAERTIAQWTNDYFPVFAMALAHELANEEKAASPSRLLSALLLKVLLSGREQESNATAHKRWLDTDRNIRGHIKQMALAALRSPQPSVRSYAAQVVQKIALIELPQGQWPDLIEMLVGNMTVPNIPTELRQATLETVGYICEEINPQVLAPVADKLLTAIIQGMLKQETNLQTKLYATKAMNFALPLFRKNFERDNERTYIVDTLIELAGEAPDPHIRKAGMECLVQIASLYYEFLPPHIERIFKVTWKAIKEGEEEDIQLQAIEFWSSICDEELAILEELEEGLFTNRKCHNFIKSAVEYLAPVMTAALAKSEDVPLDDPDAWNVSMAAATCLGLISNVAGNAVVPHVEPFIHQHIRNPNWRYREAAAMALGSILDGPKNIDEKIAALVPALLDLMHDPETAVRDTVAWTLGRVAEHHINALAPHFIRFMETMITSLNDPEPRVASNVCWTINNLAEAFPSTMPNHPLAQYFVRICQGLIVCADRPNAEQANLRTSAYETLNAIILSAPNEVLNSVGQLVPVFIDRLEKTFTLPILGKEDRERQSELQGLICGVLQMLTNRLDAKISPYSDRMMILYLRVFDLRGTSSVHEEALLAVGALISALQGEFEKYMKDFQQYLLAALQNWQEKQVCSIAVGITSDLARALGKKFALYSDQIVYLLLQNLRNADLDKSIKPSILSTFGDIAMELGGQFADKYFTYVMDMLRHASATAVQVRLDQMQTQDYDLISYMNNLREGICEAYAGIIQGLQTDGKVDLLVQHAPFILSLINHIAQDKVRTEEVSRAAVGVIGDLALHLGTKIGSAADLKNAFMPLIEDCLTVGTDSKTQSTAEYAKEMLERL